jgi:competence protein ComEC
VEGLVLVRAPRYSGNLYGDRLRIRGTLQTPPVFKTFSYRDYLARQNIHSTIGWARIAILERNQANRFYAWLLALKRRAHAVITDVVPEPSASLLSGILLGIEGGIADDLLNDFHSTGTSHIIAISGFNLAIVGGMAASLSVRMIGRRHAAWLATAAIALYTLLVGAAAAVVRAAVMSVVAVWGQHFGRQNSAPNALFATALLMTAWNPHTLWDAGFTLSFAATLGLIWFAEPFQRALEGFLARLLSVRWAEPTARSLHEPVVQSTSCQLMTLPIVLSMSRSVSLVSLVSNALVLPLQMQVMLWGAAATVGGLLWRPLGRVLGWVAWLPLAGTIAAVEKTADLSIATVEVGSLRPVMLIAWYGALGVLAWLLGRRPDRRKELWLALQKGLSSWLSSRLLLKMALGGLAIVATLVWLAVLRLPDGRLHVTFLDVGEGSATYVETPTGQQILINGGPSPSTLLAHLGQRLPFYDRTLDLVVLSDDREGHLEGLVPVLERYHVGYALYAPQTCRRTACAQWREWLRDEAVAVVQPVAGATVDVGSGVLLTVLDPSDKMASEGGPVVLRLDYGQTCFLLVHDAGDDVERALLAAGPGMQCDVLYVGTRVDAPSALFVEAVRPALIVFSGEGGKNAKDVAAMAVRTSDYGSIEIVSNGERYEVQKWR